MAFLDLKSLKTEIDGKANKSVVTTSADGLMSASDKTKLNGIASGANNYSHPTSDGNKHVPANGTTNSGKFLQATATAGTYQWANVPLPSAASTSKSGIVQLNDAINSTSTTQAATANAVKKTYDKINSTQLYKLTGDNGESKVISSGSYDDIIETGIYTCTDGVTEKKPFEPYSGWVHLEVINPNNHTQMPDRAKWVVQKSTIFEGIGHGVRTCMRICQNGTWTHWANYTVDGQATKMTHDDGACRGIPNNNANDINITGFWMGSNVTNAPTVQHQWVYIESKVHNHLYQNQIATDLHDSSKRWTRHKTNGIWSEWRSL